MNPAPNPVDIQDIHFKQSTTQQITEDFSSIPPACSLLATDGKRGLIYVGHNNKLTILKSDNISSEFKIELELPYTLCRLALSCDCSYLAVSTPTAGTLIYNANVLSRNNLELLQVITLSTSRVETFIRDLQWNPTIPDMLCIVDSNNSIGNLQLKADKVMLTPGPPVDALCVAWSPKGKQIVVGCQNGNILQCKPDFKLVRTINGPVPSIGKIIALRWISNYQFCAAYLEPVERRINVLIIDAPKGEKNAVFTYYEDITYGMPDAEGTDSLPRYYLEHIQEWNLIIAASSNSSEVAILGSTDNGATWLQWTPGEGSRAELPLKSRKSHTESYPVGLAVDRSSVEKLPWGTDSYLPYPVPKLHVLGTSGQLCSFHIINLFPNCPAICTRPTETVQMPISRPSIVPSEVFALPNATATSTPRPNQTVMVTENPKVVPAANLFGGVSTNETASAKSSGFASTIDSKQLPKPHVNQFQSNNVPSKVNETLAPVSETTGPSQEPNDKKDHDSSIDDSIRIRAYTHVQSLFEKELSSRLQHQTWYCGTAEERAQLIEKCAAMDEFLRELRETTNGLSSDIAYLKALLLQTFAWVEETKSKNTVSTNITPRKHGDTGKIAELKRLYYYTQSQLSQATKALDLEWSDQKAYERMKMKIPSSEYLYQTLMKHNKIIAEEKRKIEYLTKKWKMLSRTSGISGLNDSMSNMRLTTPKPTVQSYSGDVDVIEARCKAIALRTLNFTHEKQMKLRNVLSRSTPRIIKPVNPSPIQDRLEATLSSLASSGAVTTEVKEKAEPLTNKQITSHKPADDRNKSQSPLTSLTNIVARIGSSEGNDTQATVKSQNKVNVTNNSFTVSCGNKYPQLETKNTFIASVTAVTTTVSAPLTTSSTVTPSTTLRNKDKQEFTTFSQPSISSTIMPGIKAFPKVDSISFGTPSTKAQDLGPTKLPPKEVTTKNDSSTTVRSTNESPKVDSNLVANISLKDTVLSTGMMSKPQAAVNGNLSTTTTTLKPTDVSSTFSFATSNTVASLIKTPVPEPATTLPSSNAQVFSFASKSPNAFSFALKTNTASATPALSQGPLDMSGLSLRLQPTDIPSSGVSEEKTTTANGTTLSSSTFSFAKPPSSSMSVFRIPATIAPQSAPSTTASISITPITTPMFSKPVDTPPVTATFVESSPQVSSATSSVFSSTQQTVTSAPLFGQATSSTPPTTTATVFGSVTSISGFGTSSAAPVFSGFSGVSPATATTLSSVPLSTATTLSSSPTSPSIATSIGGANLAFATSAKPAFGDLTKTLPTTSFTGTTSTPTSSITFGTVNSADTSTAVSFEKVSLSPVSTNTQFSSAGASPPNIFGRTPTTVSTPFGESSKSTSVFGGAPTTTSTTTIFGGAGNSTIFGSKSSAASTSTMFGNNATSGSVFGAASTGSVFKSNAGKPGLIFGGNTAGSPAASPFGNVANRASAAPNSGIPSPFGNITSGTSAAPNTGVSSPFANVASGTSAAPNAAVSSPFGSVASGTPAAPNAGVSAPFGNVAAGGTPAAPNTGVPSIGSSAGLASPQSAFGEAPTFGAKPMFGTTSPVFGASKPTFGSGFGSTTFGVPSTPGGFGSPPNMGGTSPLGGSTMTKVFGGTTGSSTFESLADQAGGLTFGSLAQKSPEAEKPPPFSGGSSFSSWR